MARSCCFLFAAAVLSGAQAGVLKLGSGTRTSEDDGQGLVTCDGNFTAHDVHAAGGAMSLKELIAEVTALKSKVGDLEIEAADLNTQLLEANAVIAANVDTSPGYRYWRFRFDSNPYSGTRAWFTLTEVEYYTAEGKISPAELVVLPEVGKLNGKNEQQYREKMYDGVHGPYLSISWSSAEDGTMAYGLDFGHKVEITECRVVGPSNQQIHYSRQADAYLEYSDNGISWHVGASHIGAPTHTHGATVIMTMP